MREEQAPKEVAASDRTRTWPTELEDHVNVRHTVIECLTDSNGMRTYPTVPGESWRFPITIVPPGAICSPLANLLYEFFI